MEPLILLVAFAVASGVWGERNRLLPMLVIAFAVAFTYYFQKFL